MIREGVQQFGTQMLSGEGDEMWDQALLILNI